MEEDENLAVVNVAHAVDNEGEDERDHCEEALRDDRAGEALDPVKLRAARLEELFNRFAHSAGPGIVEQRENYIFAVGVHSDPQMAPRWSQDGPKRPQYGPKRPQDGPKMAPRGPKRPQEAPRWLQDGSKMAPRGPKMDPRGPKK